MAKDNNTVKSVTKTTGTDKQRKETRVEVREIKNGFIIRKNTEWNDPKKGWQYVNEEWYSETDPLEITDQSLADIFD